MECDKSDIIFVVDNSQDVTDYMWSKVKEYMKKVITELDIGWSHSARHTK